MRKDQLKLIKRTERWLHRKKGSIGFSFPTDIDTEKITRFVILGRSDTGENGTLRGVGDYEASSGSYVIGLHVRGKNLLGGRQFAEKHIEKQICTVSKPSLGDTNYSFVPDVDKEGRPIIDGSVIKFKEKTAYTLAFTARYLMGTTPKDLKITFEYTDGTSYTPIYDTIKKTITDCVSTDPEKTVRCISSYTGDHRATIFVLADFGLYEGIYTAHAEMHEPYVGEHFKIELDAPLYSIGYASDELDLKSGKLMRKIGRLRVDGSALVSETDTEGIFEIALPSPMRPGSRTVSPYGEISEDSECGISASESESSLLLKPPGGLTSVSEVKSYLEANAFDIFYILASPVEQGLNIACPNLGGKSAIDVTSEISPRKCFVEYY